LHRQSEGLDRPSSISLSPRSIGNPFLMTGTSSIQPFTCPPSTALLPDVGSFLSRISMRGDCTESPSSGQISCLGTHQASTFPLSLQRIPGSPCPPAYPISITIGYDSNGTFKASTFKASTDAGGECQQLVRCLIDDGIAFVLALQERAEALRKMYPEVVNENTTFSVWFEEEKHLRQYEMFVGSLGKNFEARVVPQPWHPVEALLSVTIPFGLVVVSLVVMGGILHGAIQGMRYRSQEVQPASPRD
jgi:hypothetical protein